MSQVSISSHGFGQLSVTLSTDDSERYNQQEENLYQRSNRHTTDDEVDHQRNLKAIEFIKKISSKMCKGGKISIVQCNAENPAGDLKKSLENIVGPDVEIETFVGQCGLKFGQPVEL
jgi:hypothetical protein